ncbi:MAG TPA: hypothetical protein PLL20_18280 [Phycisphaerae bacterium]|nr:hypothetical protein [Phycisphaerae bacterium]HRR86122.1 hypothetical protein [Phycisphaerae bacterium]
MGIPRGEWTEEVVAVQQTPRISLDVGVNVRLHWSNRECLVPF